MGAKILGNAVLRMAGRAAFVLAAAGAAGSAIAAGDCLSGFNCGRVAWIDSRFGEAQPYQLWTRNVDGSRRTMLAEFGPTNHGSSGGLVFSADARRMYFFASATSSFDSNIWSIGVDGTGLVNLTNDSCSSTGSFVNGLSLSPDGTRIAFARNCGGSEFDRKIWLMDVDGSDLRLLTTSPVVNGDPTGDKHDNPHFSPDGTHVVFDSVAGTTGSRQVYISSLDGTSVAALTTYDEFGSVNRMPRFLPDGRVVFASRRDAAAGSETSDLYRINADGTNRLRLTNLAGDKLGLVPSPDGSRIAFINDRLPDEFDDGHELYVVATDGTGLVPLSPDPARFARTPRFSPDGTKIGFQMDPFSESGIVSSHVIDVDGSNRVDYFDPAQDTRFSAFGLPDVDGDGVIDGADSCPALANGYRVAFASTRAGNRDIWTTDYTGGDPRRLAPSSGSDTSPSFSGDGRRIAFASDRPGRYEIYSMQSDGTDLLRLTNVSGINVNPAFSPDGTKVVFISSREGGQRNTWIMDSDGANQVKITFNQGVSHTADNPEFNHDGTRIAFDSDRFLVGGGANHDIYAIDPTGANEVRLTTAVGRDAYPSYSRDGRHIVFISYRDGAAMGGEIYTMDADGTNQVRVTQSTKVEFEPTFSPDGAQIVFGINGVVSEGIYAINRDGTGLRRITNTTALDVEPSLAPQVDVDGDGAGDECDPSFDASTQPGASVTVQGPSAGVTFPLVTSAGTTTFTPILPAPGDLPAGFTLCAACTAWEITTTATYTPPITVCIAVPSSVPQPDFLVLRLLHGEGGVYVDRTTAHVDEPSGRKVCGEVSSLSPFALATFTAPQEPNIFASGFEDD